MFSSILSKLFKTREKVTRAVQDHETERRRAEDPDWTEEDQFDDSEKPFLEHLDDLRVTLIKLVVTLLVTTIFAFIFNKQLLNVMKWPLHHAFKDRPDIQRVIQQIENLGDPTVNGAEDKKDRDTESEEPKTDQKADPAAILPTVPVRPALSPDASVDDRIAELEARITAQQVALDSLRGQVLDVAKSPPGTQTIKPTAYFISTIKLCFISGIILSFPLLLYFLAEFVFPGLKRKEKKVVVPSLAIGFGLFLMGACFCFFVVLPRVLQFFDQFSKDRGVEASWTIEYYLSFASQLVLIFGLCFELPVVVLALVKMGLLNFTAMKNTFSYAVVIIFAVGAIITPTPDALTLCLLAAPMIGLYVISMGFAYFIERRDRQLYPELYQDEDLDDDPDGDDDPWSWAKGDDGDDDDDGGGSGGSASSGAAASLASSAPKPQPRDQEGRAEWNKDEHALGWDEVLAEDEHHYGEEPGYDPYHDEHGNPREVDEHGHPIDPYHDEHGNPREVDEHGHPVMGDHPDADHDEVSYDEEPSGESERQEPEQEPEVPVERSLEEIAAEDEAASARDNADTWGDGIDEDEYHQDDRADGSDSPRRPNNNDSDND